MRKITITKDESGAIYTVLNQPTNPQAGLSIKEVRKIGPIIDKIEALGVREEDAQGTEIIIFNSSSVIELKESEYNALNDRIENSSGWASAAYVRQVINPLLEKFEEAEKLDDTEEK